MLGVECYFYLRRGEDAAARCALITLPEPLFAALACWLFAGILPVTAAESNRPAIP